MGKLAHHANLNHAEGGFCVQNIDGKPIVSDMYKSQRMGSVHDRDKSYSTDTNAYQYDWKSNSEYIIENVFLTVHSHPFLRRTHGTPEEILCPSTPDLETWERIKLDSKNPQFIDGIFVKKGNKGLLLIYQDDPTQSHDTYYQAWDEGVESRNTLLRLMRESGIRYETLEFDIKSSIFPEQEMEKLKTFASE